MEVRNADNGPAPPSPLPAAAPSKQSKPWPPAVDTNSVTQRLQKELMTLMMSGDLGVSAFPEAENIFCWIGTIEGGIGTSYEGLSFKLSLRFPLDYPFKPPQVKFETACFHPNVDQYGNICLDILQDMWSSAYDCRTILLSIQSLLGEPNIESPLNIYAANLWNNQEEWQLFEQPLWMQPPVVPHCIVNGQTRDLVTGNPIKKLQAQPPRQKKESMDKVRNLGNLQALRLGHGDTLRPLREGVPPGP
ncbi:hypothetical protein Taro_021313 [Colocasia esculenta]|uniref:E2 ubiquitin-conjugating enzyme n=1 Tax=Colocasia esculenta TaxID=4460 RepID=A0A843UYP6_COLES|nr:hypothetical protein [Colocasia esculenta]